MLPWATYALVLTLWGHRLPAMQAPADPVAQARPANAWLVNHPGPTIEVLHVDGAAPPAGAVEEAVLIWSRYLGARPTVRHAPPIALGAADRAPSMQDLVALLRQSGGDLTVVVWPRTVAFDYGAFYTVLPEGGRWRSLILMHDPLELGVVPTWLTDRLWTQVLLHELGHALHVPTDPKRIWFGLHCTDSGCVLYPRLDHRSAITILLRKQTPWTLCDACAAEAAAVRR